MLPSHGRSLFPRKGGVQLVVGLLLSLSLSISLSVPPLLALPHRVCVTKVRECLVDGDSVTRWVCT